MSDQLTARDLAVVIPTRDRWPILGRTLEGLSRQRSSGFETVVVVDGSDQRVPHFDDVRVIVKEHGGPGAARNAGVKATDRSIVLFLGDDMVPDPDLVTRHLDGHVTHPGHEVAVLGHVDWHPDASQGRVQSWMNWSRTQFDFPVAPGEAGFGRFYSCNVSLKRDFFLESGGFDEAFTYFYEDLDYGWRASQKGMKLLYDPSARAEHLHRYDESALARRFRGVGMGEYLMASKHPWFEPHFLLRVKRARQGGAVNQLWTHLVEWAPPWTRAIRRRAEERANLWYYQKMAEPFLAGWSAAEDLSALQDYLGPSYDHSHLVDHQGVVDAERDATGDEETFYRVSREYLYDLTAFSMSGTKAPYLYDLRRAVPRGGRLLDYGCGIGADGLRLASDGYRVAFADFANPSTEYLKWRLARASLEAPVYDLDSDELPQDFDAAYSFDVIEHVEDPFDFLARLERSARLVIVNFLEEDAHDTDLHRPLPIGSLLDHAANCGLVRYRKYHGRSHFVIYRSPRENVRSTRSLRSLPSSIERRVGARLGGGRAWYPVPST